MSAQDPYQDSLRWLFAQRRTAPPDSNAGQSRDFTARQRRDPTAHHWRDPTARQRRDPARMRALLERLDIPATVLAVHIVGTTGKGTVAAMVEHGLRADGVRTGRFTSPHVEDFRERIEVGGAAIRRDDVTAFVERVRMLAPAPAPAFFEIALAMALDRFARSGVETAVVEAGVGARDDATSVLERVVASVVTNVSLDHAATLGGTVAAIARDKAAAVRPGAPTVTGATGVARAVLLAAARDAGTELHADPPGGDLFDVPTAVRDAVDPARQQNQRLAAAALRLLGASEDAVTSGVAAPALPARRELFRVDGRRVLLDGAHNVGGAAALAASLHEPFVLVFGSLGRKDGSRTLRSLERLAVRVYLTEAAPGEGVPAARVRATVVEDPVEAVQRALASAPAGGLVVVAGSLYLAGRLRPFLRALHAPGAVPADAPTSASGG